MSLTHRSEMNDDGGEMIRNGVDDFLSCSLLRRRVGDRERRADSSWSEEGSDVDDERERDEGVDLLEIWRRKGKGRGQRGPSTRRARRKRREKDSLPANPPKPNPRPVINSNLLRWKTRMGGGLTMRYLLKALLITNLDDFFLVGLGLDATGFEASPPGRAAVVDEGDCSTASPLPSELPSSSEEANDPVDDASEFSESDPSLNAGLT